MLGQNFPNHQNIKKMKILKYNIKKPEQLLNFGYYFNYRGLTRKERRTKMVVIGGGGLLPVRKYYAAIVNFGIRQYNKRMETYNLLCAQKRNHLIKSIYNNL